MCERELIILGTGYALAVDCYNTCFAIRMGDSYMLVDAGGGNGILRQCRDASIDFRKIGHLFVTHGHTDHLLGVVWVIRKIATLMVTLKYEGNFIIHAHRELSQVLDSICSMTLNSYHYDLIGKRILFEDNVQGRSFRVLSMQVTPFDIMSSKKTQFGFTALFDDGFRLSCLGDEPFNPQCADFVRGADLLMSEAFCLYADRDRFKPYEKHHATVADAARAAIETGARELLIYHTEDTFLASRKERYSREASELFPGRVYVPDDLERIEF